MRYVTAFDVAATKLIGKIPRRMHAFFHALGFVTAPVTWAALLIAVIVYGTLHDMPVRSLLAILILTPVATLLKLGIRRTRPPTIYAENMKVKSYSFPSSHAYSSALVCGYFAALCALAGMAAVAAAFVVLAGVIGISRIHLGAHYPSDVIGGWLLGTILVALALAF